MNLWVGLVPWFGLAAFAGFHVALRQARPEGSLLRSMAVAWTLGAVTTVVLASIGAFDSANSLPEHGPMVALHVGSYLALGYGYFHFVNLGETARRIRILHEIDLAGGALHVDTLLETYNASMMVDVRLERLIRSGQVIETAGELSIGSPEVLRMARLMGLFKGLFRVDSR